MLSSSSGALLPSSPCRLLLQLLSSLLAAALCVNGQPPQQSPECKKAAADCETATDCVHRLAVLQSACVTNTCQPQCREAALNLYQNREGRALLRTDASCVPGRYELEKCGFLPNKSPKHCSLAKLICETDLQCNAKWELFVSECETETNELGRCTDKCRRYLNATLSTAQGAAFGTCTCTDKEDARCTQLRDLTLHACMGAGPAEPSDEDGNDGPLVRPEKPPATGRSDELEGGDNIDNNGGGEVGSNRVSGSPSQPLHTPSSPGANLAGTTARALGQRALSWWMALLPLVLGLAALATSVDEAAGTMRWRA